MLQLIYAKSRNGVIGKDGQLPWELPEDLAHFKRSTLGCPVIMGRRTWESLPQRQRPLPGRRNVIVSRTMLQAPVGAELARSLEEAVRLVAPASPAWVIGGAQLFTEALPLAGAAVVTEIDCHVDGDTFAPAFGPGWLEVSRQRYESGRGLRYDIVRYERLSARA